MKNVVKAPLLAALIAAALTVPAFADTGDDIASTMKDPVSRIKLQQQVSVKQDTLNNSVAGIVKDVEQKKADEEAAKKKAEDEAAAKNDSSSSSASTASSGNSTASVNVDDFDFICACVQAEGGASYKGALDVMSCVMNRVDSGRWGGKDPVSVLKAPGQFTVYSGGQYRRYIGGKSSSAVQQAVRDCMNGKRSHHYQSFHAGNGGNVFY